MWARDCEPRTILDSCIVVRALTAPRSIRDHRTSSVTLSRGRAEAESEKRISSAAGVLYPQFGANEIEPLQRRFTQINEWIGDEAVRFNPYTIKRAAAAA
jgi:hypothetical protein